MILQEILIMGYTNQRKIGEKKTKQKKDNTYAYKVKQQKETSKKYEITNKK